MSYSYAEGSRTAERAPSYFDHDAGLYPRNLVLPGSLAKAQGPQASAINDILMVVEARAAAYFNANFFFTNYAKNHPEEMAHVQQAYREATTLTERFGIFFDCPLGANAADLGILKNNGLWLSEETRQVEAEITEIADAFASVGMSDGIIDPTTPEADIAFHVLAGVIDRDDVGKINLRHKRTLFKTRPYEVVDADGKRYLRTVSVDKVAEHSLDLAVLDTLQARKGVTQLLECAARGDGKMEVPRDAREFVYGAINNARDGYLVSRAATIYYVANKLTPLRPEAA